MSKTSRINRQQQIQVLIRLKPQLSQQRYQKCAYVSEQEQNALVVETPTKKQYFVFDSVANQHITQLQLYHTMGRQAVTQTLQVYIYSIKGFNCCIFAYGQTGSGKTYSILGAIQDIMSDIYAESRGILPRLLQDLMRQVKQNTDRASILCSYMQIYNEQIFDLLNQNMRSLSIRQGKKGVYVQNLLQQNVSSYEDAISLVIKGQKNRKIASTSMNNQSSRSHTIFTIYLQSEINSQQKSMTRRSKIHIVDLAGSERVKHTNVQGDRLKQGCKINKSLHVLGSVINALVESTKTKKQKHVPFRDSKLTHFLKDSLAGNSITKLLATIQSNKLYYGDTLSTLMFAKRAKIIRVKVQANQNATDNYDSLRKQVKRLREQLAQTKYLAEGRFSERFKIQNDTDNYNNQIDTQNLQYSTTDKPIHIFEQNELHYKALIQIYEQHMNECMNYNDQNDVNKNNVFKKKNNNIINHSQWKKLEKKNKILTDLLRKMPAFTRIFRENQLLKQERSKYEQNIKINEQYSINKLRNQLSLDTTTTNNMQPSKHMHSTTIQLSDISLSDNSILQQSMITSPQHQQLIRQAKQKTALLYQQLIDQIKQQFSTYIDQLDKSYNQLQGQIQQKDKKIKEIFKRNIEQRPQIQELNDENQYLKLNILQLQDEIAELQKQLEHIRIQKKQLKRRNTIQQQNQQDKDIMLSHKNSQKYQDNSINSINMSASSHKFVQSTQNIQQQQNSHEKNINDQHQHKQIYQQNNSNFTNDQQIIQYLYKLRQDAIKQMQIYQKQQLKMIQCIQVLQKQCKRLDIDNKSQLLKIQSLKISKNNLINKLNKISAQHHLQLQQINEYNILQSEEILSFDALWKQINSQKMTFQQLQAYKSQTKKQYQTTNIKLKEMDQIKNQLNVFYMKQKAVQKQFGKSIDKILDQYAEIIEKNVINQ